MNDECLEEALFLDIDGVMSRCKFGEDLYGETYSEQCTALHRPAIAALKMLLDLHPKMKIVWISDWAYGENPYAGKCVASPLDVLKLYPWLSSRIYGSISKKMSASKIDGIISFLNTHPTKSFAILDDDYCIYPNADDNDIGWISRNYVRIDPEKAFAATDIKRIENVLEFPMAGKYLHYLIANTNEDETFIINGKYQCTFDLFKHKSREDSFLVWKKNPMCLSREECTIDVNVYDMKDNKMAVCQIVLAKDDDLSKESRYNATIYFKDNVIGQIKSGTNVLAFEYC